MKYEGKRKGNREKKTGVGPTCNATTQPPIKVSVPRVYPAQHTKHDSTVVSPPDITVIEVTVGDEWATIQRGFRVGAPYSAVRFSPIQYRGPGPSRPARSPGLANWQSRSDKQPQPMHRVRPTRRRSNSAMRSSIRLVQLEESFAQSARSGTRFSGSFASSRATSWRVKPIRWAKTMNAIRRSAALGYRR
jgi:hypothetical protein